MQDPQPTAQIGDREETVRVSPEVAERAAEAVVRGGGTESFAEWLMNYTHAEETRIVVEGHVDGQLMANALEGTDETVTVVPGEDGDE